ncbi:MAG: hypothetical protein JO290_03505 [Sphingomonadaceae bacterium]|nr:hypothetical protein [Sphingomonadaceae bacterium]
MRLIAGSLLAAALLTAAPALAGSAIVYQGQPPAPSGNPPAQPGLAISYTIPDAGAATTTVTFTLYASASSRNAQRTIGICLVRPDNSLCGPTAKIFADTANSHRALVPVSWTVTSPRASRYDMFFAPLKESGPVANTVWDANDSVLIIATW